MSLSISFFVVVNCLFITWRLIYMFVLPLWLFKNLHQIVSIKVLLEIPTYPGNVLVLHVSLRYKSLDKVIKSSNIIFLKSIFQQI